MNRFKRLSVGLLCGLCFATANAQNNSASVPVRIDVDAQRSSPMPALMRAGIFTFKAEPPAYALNQWLTEMRPGVVEIDIGGTVFQQADDADDAVLRARRLLPLLKRITAAGGEPLLAITRIPIWLSSKPRSLETADGDVVPKAAVVAPRDGNEWAALVTRVVTEWKQGLGKTPDIKIGWEPDQSAWQGTEADFFAFYRDTARGVKRADPNARVGGPGVSALYNGKGGDGAAPLIPRFLRYCADTPLFENDSKGSSGISNRRLPVDFLIWHQFGSEAVLSWDLAANQARAWLKEADYPESTELVIGEWSSWYAWPQASSPEQDQPGAAAYVVASLAAMERAKVSRAAYTSLIEQREVEAQPFIGSFGLFSNQFIKKPSYWAFQAVGRLGGTRLQARSSDPLVSVIAGQASAQEVALVVAVSTPNERSLQRALMAKALSAGATIDQLRRELNPKQIERITQGQMKPDELRASEPLRRALSSAALEVTPLAQQSRAQSGKSRSITLELTGFDASKSTLEIWRIDSRHANAYALRERISEHLNKRLQQEKQSLPQGLSRRLQERGDTPENVEAFKQVMNARNREEALAQRPPAQRRALRGMADESQNYVHERLAVVGQEINAWPELAFKASAAVPQRVGKLIQFDIEDDSVALIRVIAR
jgi:Glycosyl hydrolases family 39